MGVRLTHDEFVIKITSVHGSAYSVISEYTGSANKIRVMCHTCNNVFNPIANNFLYNKSGCPVCYSRRINKDKKIPYEECASRLRQKSRKIKLHGEFVGFMQRTDFKCFKCNSVFVSSFYNVIRSVIGCPECASLVIPEAEFIKRLAKALPLVRLVSGYTNITEPARFKCIGCKSYFTAIPTDTLRSVHGCPTCGFLNGSLQGGKLRSMTILGKTFDRLQGYEPLALSLLVEQGVLVENIYCGVDVPRVSYFYANKIRKYYPDFYICDRNLIVEVKSKWTLCSTEYFLNSLRQKD